MAGWMTLLEYVFTLLDPAEAAEFRRLDSEGLKLQMQYGPDQFQEALKRHRPTVLAQLRSGALIARGHAALAPLHEQPSIISKEWWEGPWTLDFLKSSAAENGQKVIRTLFKPSAAEKGHKISRIQVCRAEDDQSAAGSMSDPMPPRLPARLVVQRKAGRVTLDGIGKDVSGQPILLLVMLAQAVLDGRGSVPTREITKEFKGRDADDLVRELRDAFVGGNPEHEHYRKLIKNRRSPSRYELLLTVDQIDPRL